MPAVCVDQIKIRRDTTAFYQEWILSVFYQGWILSHQALASYASHGDHAPGNVPQFRNDCELGRLALAPKGSYVAYHKGVFCGQSADGQALLTKATDYYGSSNLAVFRMPDLRTETLDEVIKEGKGEF